MPKANQTIAENRNENCEDSPIRNHHEDHEERPEAQTELEGVDGEEAILHIDPPNHGTTSSTDMVIAFTAMTMANTVWKSS